MPHLTEQMILDLKPSNKQYDVRDDDPVGFMVRVNTNGSKTYYVEYGRGKRLKISRFGELPLKQARNKAKQLQVSAKNGQLNRAKTIDTNMTYEEYLDDMYLIYLKSNTKNPYKTLRLLKSSFKKFLPFKLHEITPFDTEKWKTDELDKGNAKTTVNRNLGSFKASLNQAVELKVISDSPIKKIKRLKVNKKPKTRYFENYESKKVLEVLPNYPKYFQAMIIISMNTGLRKGELRKLKRCNVHIDRVIGENEIISYLEIESEYSKNGDTDMVPLNETAKNVFVEWFNHPEFIEGEWVFLNPLTKKPYYDIRKLWDQLRKETGLLNNSNFRWHDMRHDFASQLAMKGVSIQAIGALLRHKSLDMTERYAHLSPKTLRDVVAKLD